MGSLTLKDWLALLSEGGVIFSHGSGLRAAVARAAQRLDLELDPEDWATLAALEEELTQEPQPQRRFMRGAGKLIPNLTAHIPAVDDDPLPSRPIPSGEGDTEPPRTQSDGLAQKTTSLRLPPWGRMEAKLEALREGAVVPIDWNPPDGSPVTMRKWNRFLGDLTHGIDSMLWPVYQTESASWSSPEVARLFDADFKLLKAIQPNLGLPISALFPTKVVHSVLFKEEDDRNIAFGSGYERYDPTLDPVVANGLTTVLIAGMADKVGSLDLQLKQIFQRPRPYQVAFLQGRNDFGYQWARTGNTPSLVSGHCLQASLAGCTAYAAYAKRLEPHSVEVLKQFTVDIGDRRVFAGVHYPSDNLASWYVALTLVPFVFDKAHSAAARDFLWSAISTKSAVFAAIRAQAAADAQSPYKMIVDEVNRLGAVGH